MEPYPLLFHSILKPRVWGGRRLSDFGKLLPEGERIGESWELADLPESVDDGRSVVANGELAGKTLREAIAAHFDLIMGGAKLTVEGGFPLLIKFLDARENLSVQVHPDENYVSRHPGTHLKSEAWIVLQVESNAAIYKGVKPNVTKEEFQEHIHSDEVVNDLIRVQAAVGDCHYLPSGTCHALGAGVLVAEIQTPSDTTFRVYDWGRTGRELHIQEAMDCISFGEQADNQATQYQANEIGGVRTTPLASTDHFEIEQIDALQNVEIKIVTSSLPEVWMMIGGSGEIRNQRGNVADLDPGTTVLVPARMRDGKAKMSAKSWLLRVKLPSPLKGMVAHQ